MALLTYRLRGSTKTSPDYAAYRLPDEGKDVPDEFHEWVEKHGFEFESERDEGLSFIDFFKERVEARPGDWIVKSPSGFFTLDDHRFKLSFRLKRGRPLGSSTGPTGPQVGSRPWILSRLAVGESLYWPVKTSAQSEMQQIASDYIRMGLKGKFTQRRLHALHPDTNQVIDLIEVTRKEP